MTEHNSLPRENTTLTSEEIVELARQLSAPKPRIHVMQGWRGTAMTHWTNPETGQEHFAMSPEAWHQLTKTAIVKYSPSLALSGAEVRWEHPALTHLVIAIMPDNLWAMKTYEEMPTEIPPIKTVTLWPDGKVTT